MTQLISKKKKNSIFFSISLIIILVIISISSMLYIVSDSISLFYSPSKIPNVDSLREFRIGGIVKEGSIKYIAIDVIEFILTDYKKEIIVIHKGIVPSLFRENQGIVALGKLVVDDAFSEKIFKSRELLVKHDENYMPVDCYVTKNKN